MGLGTSRRSLIIGSFVRCGTTCLEFLPTRRKLGKEVERNWLLVCLGLVGTCPLFRCLFLNYLSWSCAGHRGVRREGSTPGNLPGFDCRARWRLCGSRGRDYGDGGIPWEREAGERYADGEREDGNRTKHIHSLDQTTNPAPPPPQIICRYFAICKSTTPLPRQTIPPSLLHSYTMTNPN